MVPVPIYSRDGHRLLDSRNGGKVRHMLKSGRARVARSKPFAIQLLYDPEVVQCDLPEGEFSQPEFDEV